MIWSIDNVDRNSSHKYIQISFTFLLFFIPYIWVFIHLMNYCLILLPHSKLYLGDPTIPMEYIQFPHAKMRIRGRMQIHPSTSNLTFPFGIYGLLLLLLLVATKIQIQIPPTFDMFFRRYLIIWLHRRTNLDKLLFPRSPKREREIRVLFTKCTYTKCINMKINTYIHTYIKTLTRTWISSDEVMQP
jgi:hypothetical protein